MVVDACTYADAQIVEDLYLDRLRDGQAGRPSRAARASGSTSVSAAVTIEQLAEGLELPRINYGRNNERPYRYVWGVDAKSGWLDRIVKVDVESGTTTEWAEDGLQPGRAGVRRGARGAGRGRRRTALGRLRRELGPTRSCSCWTPPTCSELARAEVPHHIPYGFHGQFVGN